jgi:hypothetical protein
VEFRILGPLEVLDDDGRPLALGGAKQRTLLAVLLLHAGRVVSAERLMAVDLQVLNPALALRARVASVAGESDQASTYAAELLAMRVEQGELHGGADWPIDLAAVLVALGRGSDLRELAASMAVSTPWLEAAAAFVGSDFERAADQYAKIGSLPDEAFARLRTAEQLLLRGRPKSVASQAPDLHGRGNGITPVDCPCDNDRPPDQWEHAAATRRLLLPEGLGHRLLASGRGAAGCLSVTWLGSQYLQSFGG